MMLRSLAPQWRRIPRFTQRAAAPCAVLQVASSVRPVQLAAVRLTTTTFFRVTDVRRQGRGGSLPFEPVDVDERLLKHSFWDDDASDPYDDTLWGDLGEGGADGSLTYVPPEDAQLMQEEGLKKP